MPSDVPEAPESQASHVASSSPSDDRTTDEIPQKQSPRAHRHRAEDKPLVLPGFRYEGTTTLASGNALSPRTRVVR